MAAFRLAGSIRRSYVDAPRLPPEAFRRCRLPPMVDAPRRRPGRPRVGEPGARLSTNLRTKDDDRLVRLALKHDRSASAIVPDIPNMRLRAGRSNPMQITFSVIGAHLWRRHHAWNTLWQVR